jgi:hypothetical protein
MLRCAGCHIKGRTKTELFENEVLKVIFGPKQEGVTGGGGKLHNEELHNLCYSPTIVRVI